MFHSNIEWQNHAQVSTQLNKMMDKLFFHIKCNKNYFKQRKCASKLSN